VRAVNIADLEKRRNEVAVLDRKLALATAKQAELAEQLVGIDEQIALICGHSDPQEYLDQLAATIMELDSALQVDLEKAQVLLQV
jgi:hypothetical protein